MSEVTRAGKLGTPRHSRSSPQTLRPRGGGKFSSKKPLKTFYSVRPSRPLEVYSKERRPAFLLENAVDRDDYERAREEVRKLGVDPDAIPPKKAA